MTKEQLQQGQELLNQKLEQEIADLENQLNML